LPALPSGIAWQRFSAGFVHTVAIRSDGFIVSWGRNNRMQCNVPPLPAGTEYVQLSGGGFHALLRRSDGIVVALGLNNEGQCNVPPGPFVEVAAGYLFSLGRRADGTVVAWGSNFLGQGNVPPTPPGVQYVEIGAGSGYSVARRSDGVVLAWGEFRSTWLPVPGAPYRYVKLGVPDDRGVGLIALRSDGQIHSLHPGVFVVPPLPPGLRYVDVATGSQHHLARRSDGIVVAWGLNDRGQCNVPPLPPGMSYVEIAAGFAHSVARRSDGTVLVWGDNTYDQHRVATLAPGTAMTRIDAGDHFTLALFASAGGVRRNTRCTPRAMTSRLRRSLGLPAMRRNAIGASAYWQLLLQHS
jgi:alpha-tubulin suppressor-like RCC1 family protein